MIISNERQYRIARAHVARFERSLRSVDEARPAEGNEADLREVYRAGIQSQLDDLYQQIAAYEDVREGRVAELRDISLLELPGVLIAARIAAGLTQRQLAERVEVREQQVQQDEATRYAGASLERLATVAALLGVALDIRATLPARGSLQPIPRAEQLIGKSLAATA